MERIISKQSDVGDFAWIISFSESVTKVNSRCLNDYCDNGFFREEFPKSYIGYNIGSPFLHIEDLRGSVLKLFQVGTSNVLRRNSFETWLMVDLIKFQFFFVYFHKTD